MDEPIKPSFDIGDAEKRGKFGTLGLCVLSELKAMFVSLASLESNWLNEFVINSLLSYSPKTIYTK